MSGKSEKETERGLAEKIKKGARAVTEGFHARAAAFHVWWSRGARWLAARAASVTPSPRTRAPYFPLCRGVRKASVRLEAVTAPSSHPVCGGARK